MSEVRPTYDDEIDLFEFFETLWDGKWKIVGVVIFSVLSVFGYQTIQPQPNFEASTEIKPTTSVEAERYRQSNALGFFEVTPNTLLNLYIEQLDERTLFEEAIRKYQLLDVEKFENKQAYEEAVIALASSIDILPPININGTEKGDVRRFWTIGFEYNDDAKWKSFLSFVDSNANQSVQRILQQRFQTSLSVAKQKQMFELEDIQTQMVNAKRDFDKEMAEFVLKQGFQLEDVQTQIDNALADYERKTSDRLAFLREQAAIARKLGVAKNTIEAQMFSAQNGVVANVKTDTPFYLRGYEAIEKEIELIELRKDIKAFIGGLFELEQKKRSLEQDRTLQRVEKNKAYLDTLIELEQKQRTLKQDKMLERAESLFASTPILNTTDFSAVSVTVNATTFETKSKKMQMLALAVVIGGMVGVVYVLISSAVRNRKQQTT
jgi:LPS O-antigen subunit length determinant protein (WzzB/FepE family)